jgi:hypothetical protein
MRNPTEQPEEVPEPTGVACEVGKFVTVDSHEELISLPPGEYEVKFVTRKISIEGTFVSFNEDFPMTLRRMS